jgi:putative OPT family oligopeptide transporter
MIVTGFLFSAVGGYLVGLVGGSNQPVSGLALSTLILSAVLMVAFGVTGLQGVGAVLGVAAVVCCACSVAGSLIQDLKVGQILGGTPWKMEVAEIVATVVTAFVLVFPIVVLHEGNIKMGGIGIGDRALPAPQAGLMAQMAQGIVGGEMPWALILFGMAFALALVLIKAPSPMLVAVGMYLPLTGVVLASMVLAWEDFHSVSGKLFGTPAFAFVETPVGAWLALVPLAALAWALVVVPLREAARSGSDAAA